MSQTLQRAAVQAALAQRLRAVGPMLLDRPAPQVLEDPAHDASVVLDLLVGAVRAAPSPDRVWLLYTAVCGAFPRPDDVLEGVRHFGSTSSVDATLWLLDSAIDIDVSDAAGAEIQLITDLVVVDVDHSARHDLHTGIQQVVRRTVPRWVRDHDVVPVAWTSQGAATRRLSQAEQARVLHWDVNRSAPDDDALAATLAVPWRTVVVLAETASQDACERLAALAQYSGNTVVAIGYDCIPVVSANLVPQVEPNRFARYLSVIKHARRVAGISESATVEFRGFAEALPAQGLRGPDVVECLLPAESVALEPAESVPDGSGRPLVLCVGSLEPRKNHLAILYAAEVLWRAGLSFELLFIASSGWGDEVTSRVDDLRAAGRRVQIRTRVSAAELAHAYRRARFTVFASLHEGYGLPVAESLAAGTPVITGDYGSTKEIGLDGGTLLIDPRDDDELLGAIQLLLTDDAELQRLRAEIASRPVRTWDQYAAELWACLVEPELDQAQ
jgi:glycosyltransferase involved in cell wall biosynthesis